jgi:FAD/FMN-containing dehydrogenase
VTSTTRRKPSASRSRGGQAPDIGVAGLTLGGGVGWLSRAYGLTSDNLRAADVVTADGERVRASAEENEDLFWALRGGGGNFGVVTAFEFDLHPLDPAVLAGSLVYRWADAAAALDRYRSLAADAPRELRLLFGSMVAPPFETYPEAVHGERVALVIACYVGDPATGREVLAPLRAASEPAADTVRERTYAGFQRAGTDDGSRRTFLRSQYLDSLTDAAVETVLEAAAAAPDPGGTVFVSPRGGAETDPPTDATAYPHREDAHHCLVEARWDDPDRDDEHVAWVRSAHEALRPHATGAAAANFLTADEGRDRVEAAYGENFERLVEVKRRWDPDGLFGGGAPVDP